VLSLASGPYHILSVGHRFSDCYEFLALFQGQHCLHLHRRTLRSDTQTNGVPASFGPATGYKTNVARLRPLTLTRVLGTPHRAILLWHKSIRGLFTRADSRGDSKLQTCQELFATRLMAHQTYASSRIESAELRKQRRSPHS